MLLHDIFMPRILSPNTRNLFLAVIVEILDLKKKKKLKSKKQQPKKPEKQPPTILIYAE